VSDQCMLCHHSAKKWPGKVGSGIGNISLVVSDEIKALPFCAFHLRQCIQRSVCFDSWIMDLEEWGSSIENRAYEMSKDDEIRITDANFFEDQPSVVYKLVRHLGRAWIDVDKFHSWFAFRLKDFSKRVEEGNGIHRCNRLWCKNFVHEVGQLCGQCEKSKDQRNSEKVDKDKVPELLRIWQSLQ